MNLTESIGLGLIFGFFFYEWIGFSAGGFVVPGYIALQLHNPLMLGITLILSFLTYGCVKVVSRIAILYGRRRFILMILAGFTWQWIFTWLVIQKSPLDPEMQAFGFIIPGLIANEMERQRILPTLLSLLIVSVLVRLTLIALGLLRS
jgi:poly-gamma-glutamate biosynthesis protein PgsC/CapC